MFDQAPTTDALHSSNMHNIIACVIALVAFSSSCLVCYAQNNQILNREQFRSLADSLLPPMTISEALNGELNQQLHCSSSPTGCTEEELAQIGWPGCAKFRLNPKTNRATCVPYQSESTTTIAASSPTGQEALEVATSIPDFEATLNSLVRSIELKRLLLDKFKHLQQQQQQQHYRAQQAKYDFDGAMRPALDEIIDVQPLEAYEADDMHEKDNGCKDSNYDDGDVDADCNSRKIPGSPFISASSGDTNGVLSVHHNNLNHHLQQQQQHKLETRAWRRSGHEQDSALLGRYQQQLVGSPHHQQFGMTTDEAARRLAESGEQEQEFSFLKGQEQESTTSSKVPIILLKFGAIRNQRRSSVPAIRGNKVLSPIRMLSYPTVRLQRSDLNNLTQMDQVKFVKGVDLDGGGGSSSRSSSSSSGGSLFNGTSMEPGYTNHQAEQDGPTATGEDNNRPQAAETNSNPLECKMRRYTFKAVKSDAYGNECSGLVSSTICYGGCETGEIADWLFPHKKAIHKVCTHGSRIRRKILLNECSSPNVEGQLREYHYVDAKSCVCQKCTSQDTNCLGSLTRPYIGSLDVPSPLPSAAASTSTLVD